MSRLSTELTNTFGSSAMNWYYEGARIFLVLASVPGVAETCALFRAGCDSTTKLALRSTRAFILITFVVSVC
jgi:hypothetical protein